ncbi:amyloid-beta A4 precursor protein-binding family A member 2-like isoform X2 [Cynoglossus semilaevis]|uniref:amyloid-beta A4 precursor protein-binding family A member 2-like isoform X2 n=1 Tax=Cynoglossus semilaevis TaxID=244447 RepID=UPI0007DCA8E1|nr:amyloid-beta A4 precursor protein-binding family A member 2-like isoform X2 [Cynoglossus semilaevis]
MAHGKRPGTISKILATSPPICSDPRVIKQSQEEHPGLLSEGSKPPPCTLKGDKNHELTCSASAKHFYSSSDPGPVEMEDTCSEYDNVGSDVEQDYDEVLHLNKEGMVDMRYYKQYCPEDGGYIKQTGCDHINGNSSVVNQFSPRVHLNTEVCEASQSDSKPHKMDHRFRSHCAPFTRDDMAREHEKSQENRFFFNDGDEIEEVLDGVRFIEDLEESESIVERPTSLYQSSNTERIKKGSDVKERDDDSKVTRITNIQGASKKCESSQLGSRERERQGKARGRRGPGEDVGHIVSGIKGCSTEPCPKTSSKDSKKAVVRSKVRSGASKQQQQQQQQQHPAPPPRHCNDWSPVESQKYKLPTETSPPPRPSFSDSQETEASVVRSSMATQHTPEPHRSPPKESQRRPEKTEQAEKLGSAGVSEDVVEQPGCSGDCPELDSEKVNTPKKTQEATSFPSFEDGPCEPEDLIDGIIFAANYLGCTQMLSDKNPSKAVRMSQAHEAVSRIKSQDEDSQMMTEVDLFISTKAVKVLNADTQETMMDSALRTISYIADIGSIVVLMARMRMCETSSEEFSESPDSPGEGNTQYRIICYVFESEDAQLIAQSIGQAFSVAYREFLRANGINPTDLSQKQYSDIINSQEMYHDDLVHFSNSDNCKELCIEKQKGESLGVVIVESGWGSILPTVILASMLNSGPAARSGKLNVGDQIMSINETSLVGLPLATCQGIIKGLKNQVKVKLSIVSCPPVTTVLIKRPDLKFQLGFSVQNGIICSLMRGGIAERGGVRVGHRIIEINGQSVVAMAHDKIVQNLSVSVREINMKTMPAVMFRLLTGQETPIYI